MLEDIQYQLLCSFFPRSSTPAGQGTYERSTDLTALMGPDFYERIAGKTVVDFGCGLGADAINMARHGARRVIGIDIRHDFLDSATQRAAAAGLQDICQFGTAASDAAEVVVSVDAFEHFADPAAILRSINDLLLPHGEALISFGPTWYHPLGGHSFSVFPWAHLLFTEGALMRWRSTFKADGATKFSEVAGGLNQMTVRHFERLVGESPLAVDTLELVPIKTLRHLHNRLTRELTTSIVRCRLIKRTSASPRP